MQILGYILLLLMGVVLSFLFCIHANLVTHRPLTLTLVLNMFAHSIYSYLDSDILSL